MVQTKEERNQKQRDNRKKRNAECEERIKNKYTEAGRRINKFIYWKKYLKMNDNVNDFDDLYEKYLNVGSCEFCNESFNIINDCNLYMDPDTHIFKHFLCVICHMELTYG